MILQENFANATILTIQPIQFTKIYKVLSML